MPSSPEAVVPGEKRRVLLLPALLLLSGALLVWRHLHRGPEADAVRAPWTTAAAREAEAAAWRADVARALALPPAPEHAAAWQRALHALGITRAATPETRRAFAAALTHDPPLPDDLLRAFLELTVALHPGDLLAEVAHVAERTASPKLFAMAVHHLTWDRPEAAAEWRPRVAQRFPDAAQHPILRVLERQLAETADRSWFRNRPDPAALLQAPFLPGRPVIFSFQRRVRDWPGRAAVRLPDKSFARTADGRLFSVAQLARSVSALPGVLTNGNTPQGIHVWRGFDVSSNRFIGPTPNLQLALPHESRRFLLGPEDAPLEAVDYAALLGPAWAAWPAAWEAWEAGLAGRSEIIAHGTTIAADWQGERPWAPVSPSHGCLTCMEFWSPEDGRRTDSDQAALVAVLERHRLTEGHVVVVDLDDRRAPVSHDECADLVRQAGP